LQLERGAECVAATAAPETPTATTSGTIKRDARRMTAKPIPIASATDPLDQNRWLDELRLLTASGTEGYS
jgi:hypothetical protein